jgi:succinate dehydrogenase hydrophobic anchor subunit
MRARIIRPPQLAVQGFETFTRRLRVMQLLDPDPPPKLETARVKYLHDRIEDQIEYFTRRSEGSRDAYRRLRFWAMLSTAIAAACAAGHVVLLFARVEGPPLTGVVSLSLVLPLVSAALLSLVLTHEHARRAARYHEMVEFLRRAAQQIGAVHTWNGLTRVAIDTEDALLAEAVEWHSYRRFASEPH